MRDFDTLACLIGASLMGLALGCGETGDCNSAGIGRGMSYEITVPSGMDISSMTLELCIDNVCDTSGIARSTSPNFDDSYCEDLSPGLSKRNAPSSRPSASSRSPQTRFTEGTPVLIRSCSRRLSRQVLGRKCCAGPSFMRTRAMARPGTRARWPGRGRLPRTDRFYLAHLMEVKTPGGGGAGQVAW